MLLLSLLSPCLQLYRTTRLFCQGWTLTSADTCFILYLAAYIKTSSLYLLDYHGIFFLIQAQNDFVNEHQQKVNEFLQEREADIQKLEEEKQQQIQALETKYKEEVERLNSLLEKEKGAREVAEKELFEEEKRQLKEEHNEEVSSLTIFIF